MPKTEPASLAGPRVAVDCGRRTAARTVAAGEEEDTRFRRRRWTKSEIAWGDCFLVSWDTR